MTPVDIFKSWMQELMCRRYLIALKEALESIQKLLN